jgi:hypothetical protein
LKLVAVVVVVVFAVVVVVVVFTEVVVYVVVVVVVVVVDGFTGASAKTAVCAYLQSIKVQAHTFFSIRATFYSKSK